MTSTGSRALFSVSLVMLTAVLLVGCTPPEPSSEIPADESAPYVEPAWMTQQVQREEELFSFQQTCLRSAGYEVTMDDIGMITWPVGTDADGGASTLATCTREFLGEDYGSPLTEDMLHGLYQRELDVRNCLRNEGYDVSPVGATEEAYVESAQGGWTAYDDVARHLDTLTGAEAAAEQVRINKVCPQPDVTGL
ncbi:hypothetical protein [Oerskovia jenensis]|uniref:hypothetical protein n=1 Tax=Oerskovia jenensis TaxID=162169 RepID=UPI0036DEF618